MFQALIALYIVLLSHCSNLTQWCNRYYCPILQKRKPRTTQDKRVSQRHTFGQSQSSESNPGLPDSKVWILLIDLMPPTWLFTCSFLDCFTAGSLTFLTKLLIPREQGQCYLFLLNMHGAGLSSG